MARSDAGGLTDPWVRPGLVLLAALSVLAVFLYTTAPQSTAEVTRRGWVAVAPDAFTPRMARARERVEAAQDALARGDTAAALARFAEGEEEALSARERAGDAERAARAAELWAGIALDRAELMLSAGTAPWWKADDTQLLTDALAIVDRVVGIVPAGPVRQRADRLAAEIRRRQRPGPLEWIPRP